MEHIDLLPRILPDKHFQTLGEARREVARRRESPFGDAIISRHAKSRRGGYRVYSVPKEEFVEGLVHPIIPPAIGTRSRAERPTRR